MQNNLKTGAKAMQNRRKKRKMMAFWRKVAARAEKMMKRRGFGPAEKQKNAKNHAFGPNLLKGCRANYVENNVKLYRNKAKKSKAGAKKYAT